MITQPIAYLALESAALSTDVKILNKEKDGKDITFYALMQEGDTPNRNNKIYPADVVWKAAQTDFVQIQIGTKSWVGEANHPLDKSLNRQLWIDKKNVSHTMLSFERKGNNFYSIVRSYRNEVGRSLMGALDQDAKVAFSLRGVHKLEKNARGINVVKELAMYTYDWVDFPAHHNAYSQHIIARESADLIVVTTDWLETALANESPDLRNMLEDFMGGSSKAPAILDASSKTIRLKTEGATVHIPLRKMSLDMLRSSMQ